MEDVLNWRRIDERITTSGQPSEEQLARICDTGVTTIMNLAPHSNKGSLKDETVSVAALGMRYINIPVDFENPTDSDFDQFTKAMIECENEILHVHCIYNARVSAFFYRRARGSKYEKSAFNNMESIWRPGGVWADFIGNPKDRNLPNRYKGDDY